MRCCLWLMVALLVSDPKREAESLMERDPAADRAGELLEKVIAANPNDAEAYYLMGRWALVKRRFARAAEASTRAAKLSSGNPAAQMQEWTIVALANDQMNKQVEADSAFRKALAFNRSLSRFDPIAAYEYLKVLERDHRDKEAYEVMTVILEKSPDYGPAHLSRAKKLAAENNIEEAVKEAEFALAHLDGGRVAERDAHYLLARLYLRLKRPDLAESHKQWLSANP
ncbi:MAG: hypothetical protein ABI165_06965 [Bryobacteraceae bacterium]